MNLCGHKAQHYKSVEDIVTSIAENEAWQGNFTDAQRELCLAWLENRLSEVVKREKTAILGTLSTINLLMGQDPLNPDDVLQALLGK
jgi:hypothetical protein